MQQIVEVKRDLGGGFAEVFLERQSACSGDCHTCQGCAGVAQTVIVRAKNRIGARPGDRVIVETDNKTVFKAIAVVYLLPLMLLLAGYLAGSAAGLVPGVFALLGFVLGVGLIVLYNKRIEKQKSVQFVLTSFAGN